MKIGTRSLLFGAHQFLLHPVFVALAWWRFYGFPWDPRLWVAFVVHDWGYWGQPNMDGYEGERHPERGAAIMTRLFGPGWGWFTLLHSRYYAKRSGKPFSRLCVADKYATYLTPAWLYVPLTRLTGEIRLYRDPPPGHAPIPAGTDWEWYRQLQKEMGEWADDYQDYGLSVSDLASDLKGGPP